MTEPIRTIHERSRGTYGAPRIFAELVENEAHVEKKRFARLLRAAGLRGICRRRGFRTTIRNPSAVPAAG